MNVNDFKQLLNKHNIDANFHEFSKSTLSVDDSAERLDIDPKKIVKSIILKDEEKNPLLAIVPGTRRVDLDKLSKIHGKNVKMAKAREVENFTGYKIGEVPPIIENMKTYMETEITNFETVVAGGGSTHTLVELSPKDIIDITDAELAKIS